MPEDRDVFHAKIMSKKRIQVPLVTVEVMDLKIGDEVKVSLEIIKRKEERAD